MADWQRTLNIAREWQQASKREISPQQMAAVIAERLAALRGFGSKYPGIDTDREALEEEFKDFAADESELDFDDLDDLIKGLYDWADMSLDGQFGGKKVCWVKTF